MNLLRSVLARFRAIVGGRRTERALDEEIQSHLGELTADFERRGMSPTAARAAAVRSFGGVTQTREAYRDRQLAGWFQSVVHDLKHSARMARRHVVFTTAAVLTLAIGFGANLAIFGLMDAVLLRSLPVPRPSELVSTSSYSFHAFKALAGDKTTGIALAASQGLDRVDIEVDAGRREPVEVSSVSGAYFSVLGVPPVIGVAFDAKYDEVIGQPAVAVLSDAYWRRRFGADRAVLGRVVTVSGTPVTIVGVAPAGFTGERVGLLPDVWMPLTMRSTIVPGRDLLRSRTTSWLDLIGRIPAGSSVEDVANGLTLRYRRILTEVFGEDVPAEVKREIAEEKVTLASAGRGMPGNLQSRFQEPLVVLMALVVLILLLACANVANLLLARSASRRKEIDLRIALGVTRARLVRQLMTESMVLGVLGAGAGALLAWPVREILLRLTTADGSRIPLVVAFDARTAVFLFASVLVTTLLFGIAPAVRAVRRGGTSLQAARGVGRRLSGFNLGSAILVGQVAVSVVLLIGAGLFVRTLTNLRGVDLGFEPEGRLVVDVRPQDAGYRGEAYALLNERLLARLTTVPGVRAATFSENGLLMGRDSSTDQFAPVDYVPGVAGSPKVVFDVVGPRYLETMGVPILAGRDFTSGDREGNRRAVIINESLARRFFAEAPAIGRRISWGGMDLEIVGVAGDVNYKGPRQDAPGRFYIPYFQHPERAELASTRFVVSAAGDPGTLVRVLESAVHEIDPRLEVGEIRAATTLFERLLVQERLLVKLSAAFAIVAVALTAIGLYGLLAYRVTERTVEIGVRRALGATRGSIVSLVLRYDLVLVFVGLAMGIPLAIASSGVARSLYFGVQGSDLTTIAASAVVMLAVGVLAAVLPARRAARVEPVVALSAD